MLATCNVCGFEKQVPSHEHAPDNMGLMDLVMSPYYSELISYSQISNPNPSPDDYCSRYDLICGTCGIKYSIHYDHKFVDGSCTRGYCDHISEVSNYLQEESDFDIEDNLEKEEEKVYTLTR